MARCCSAGLIVPRRPASLTLTLLPDKQVRQLQIIQNKRGNPLGLPLSIPGLAVGRHCRPPYRT